MPKEKLAASPSNQDTQQTERLSTHDEQRVQQLTEHELEDYQTAQEVLHNLDILTADISQLLCTYPQHAICLADYFYCSFENETQDVEQLNAKAHKLTDNIKEKGIAWVVTQLKSLTRALERTHKKEKELAQAKEKLFNKFIDVEDAFAGSAQTLQVSLSNTSRISQNPASSISPQAGSFIEKFIARGQKRKISDSQPLPPPALLVLSSMCETNVQSGDRSLSPNLSIFKNINAGAADQSPSPTAKRRKR